MKVQLKSSSVHRGGSTSRFLVQETRIVTAEIDKSNSQLKIEFSIASKGGGTTDISLTIGESDLRAVILSVAEHLPLFADTLSSAASCSVSKMMSKLPPRIGEADAN